MPLESRRPPLPRGRRGRAVLHARIEAPSAPVLPAEEARGIQTRGALRSSLLNAPNMVAASHLSVAPNMLQAYECFRCSRGMLQVFHIDVAKVGQDVAKCSRGMLQAFV